MWAGIGATGARCGGGVFRGPERVNQTADGPDPLGIAKSGSATWESAGCTDLFFDADMSRPHPSSSRPNPATNVRETPNVRPHVESPV